MLKAPGQRILRIEKTLLALCEAVISNDQDNSWCKQYDKIHEFVKEIKEELSEKGASK